MSCSLILARIPVYLTRQRCSVSFLMVKYVYICITGLHIPRCKCTYSYNACIVVLEASIFRTRLCNPARNSVIFHSNTSLIIGSHIAMTASPLVHCTCTCVKRMHVAMCLYKDAQLWELCMCGRCGGEVYLGSKSTKLNLFHSVVTLWVLTVCKHFPILLPS